MSFSLVPPGVGRSKDLNALIQGMDTGFSNFPPDLRSERKFVVGYLPLYGLLIDRAGLLTQQALRTHEGTLSPKE